MAGRTGTTDNSLRSSRGSNLKARQRCSWRNAEGPCLLRWTDRNRVSDRFAITALQVFRHVHGAPGPWLHGKPVQKRKSKPEASGRSIECSKRGSVTATHLPETSASSFILAFAKKARFFAAWRPASAVMGLSAQKILKEPFSVPSPWRPNGSAIYSIRMPIMPLAGDGKRDGKSGKGITDIGTIGI